MAVKQINKLRVYESLYRTNRALHAVLYHLHELEESRLMPIVKMGVLRNYVRELKAEISHDVVDKMHEIEDEEMYRWEKTRIAREKYLDPTGPLDDSSTVLSLCRYSILDSIAHRRSNPLR